MKKLLFSAILMLGLIGLQAQETASTKKSCAKKSCCSKKSTASTAGTKECSPELCLGATVEARAGALVVTSVMEDSPAAKAGIQVGDQITATGDQNIASLAELNAVMMASTDKNVSLAVSRDGETMVKSLVMNSQMKKSACATGCKKACCS